MKEIDSMKAELINTWIDDIIQIVQICSNGNINLSNERLQLSFLIARFSANVVYGALDEVSYYTKPENYLSELLKVCQFRFKEIYGVER